MLTIEGVWSAGVIEVRCGDEQGGGGGFIADEGDLRSGGRRNLSWTEWGLTVLREIESTRS